MKKGILSIIVVLIGFFFVYRCNIVLQEMYLSLINGAPVDNIFIDDFISFRKLYIIVIICISLLSFYLGIISFLKKNKLGSIGIVLSILLCILAFIPFYDMQ